MTKLFALIAAMAMTFSLVACSSNKPTDSTVTEVESIGANVHIGFGKIQFYR